jgi:hypothetical protein
MLSVRKENVGAIKLYRRHGFLITGDLGGSWVMELHRLQCVSSPAVEAAGDLLAVR